MSRFSESGGQSIGASDLASVFPMTIQVDLRLADFIFFDHKRLSSLLQLYSSKASGLSAQLSLCPKSHIHKGLMEKT